MDGLMESVDWTETWIARTERVRASEIICVGPSVVDCRTGLVDAGGELQRLRRKELELLAYLHANIAVTFTREELLRQVWRCQANVVTRTVDQTVATLRRKIGDDANAPKYLLTIYGVGYQLAPERPSPH